MKRFILAGLSGLVFSAAIAPVTLAEPISYNPAANAVQASNLTPFELVSLANQGYLTAEGIPSQGALVTEYRLGRVSAADVIQAAIQGDRVSADVANDAGYASAVEAALDTVTYTR